MLLWLNKCNYMLIWLKTIELEWEEIDVCIIALRNDLKHYDERRRQKSNSLCSKFVTDTPD